MAIKANKNVCIKMPCYAIYLIQAAKTTTTKKTTNN